MNLKAKYIPFFSKFFMVMVGAAIIAFAYLSKNFEGILEAYQLINGTVGGPTVGFFTIGVFLPWISELPAVAGLISGLTSTAFIFSKSRVRSKKDWGFLFDFSNIHLALLGLGRIPLIQVSVQTTLHGPLTILLLCPISKVNEPYFQR